jgi:hypothetical protein
MKFNFRQALKVSLGIGTILFPPIGVLADLVEDKAAVLSEGGVKAGWSGPEKQQAVVELMKGGLHFAEDASGTDLFNDPAIDELARKAIDAVVSARNLEAQLRQAILAAKQVREAKPPAA